MPPILFVLKNTFEYCFENFIEEETSITYNERLETDWLIFWQSNGEKIVNSSWFIKYSEYVLKEDEEENKLEEVIADEKENKLEEVIADEKEQNTVAEITLAQEASKEIPSEVDTYSCQWQNLWNIHNTEVYEKTYQHFSIVHYHHYSYYRPNIQEELLTDISSYASEEELELLEQTKQLQALGLPTSFGRSNKKYQKIRLGDSGSDTLSDEEEEEDIMPHSKQNQPKKEVKNKKKKNRKLKRMPKFILEDKSLRSYWHNRFSLFSRFDEGIQLDHESWFSVTPEKVAIHMAERLSCDTIIDAFCGSGGNSIQFAFTCAKVIAIDIDPEKIKNARHNAKIYGVADKIDFIIGDYIQLSESLKGDVVFLSPPWGGPKYISQKEYDIEESLAPLGATDLAMKSRQISKNMAFFLPRNSNPKQIAKVAGIGNRVEVEHNYLNTRLVGLTAIYGDWLIDKKNLNVK